MEPVSQRDRFETAKERLAACASDARADASLRNWVLPADRHLPSIYMDCSLRDVLNTPFSLLETTKGIGPTRLDRLLAVIERAVTSVSRKAEAASGNGSDSPSTAAQQPSPTQVPVMLPEAIDVSALSEEQWQTFSAVICQHRLDHYPIARFARSLRDVPRGLWHEPLKTFTGCSLAEIRRAGGYGESRIGQVAQIAFELATFLSALPSGSQFSAQVLPTAILEVTHWVEHVLAREEAPDFDDLRDHFVLPLVRQLETDLGTEIARMIERRLGVSGEPETLDQIAVDYDLTRERIRQLTARAPEVLQVRWTEGRHGLDDFYEKFRDTPDAHPQVQLIRRVLDQLFEVSTARGASHAEVLSEWEAAGRRKQTPMTEQEICSWLAGVFPELAPATGLKWIIQEALAYESADRGLIYFTNDDLDVLLYELYRRAAPTDLSDLLNLDEKDERNMRNRISRDARFIEDDYKRLLPSENCSVVRISGVWHVRLQPHDSHASLTQPAMAIEALAHSVVSALLQTGIADATVWGVYRFANHLLEQTLGARLPETLTPFILGDMFVCLTNGLIRPMRRRRLRWDLPHHAVRARGKRGWVSHVVLEHGIPITLDELGDLLRCHYQDYAPYVLSQINLADEEEGELHCSALLYPGVPHRVPPILIPGNWQLDPTEDNVSDEIKLLLSKLVLMMRENALCDADLCDAPWLFALVKRHSYGGAAPKSTARSTAGVAARVPSSLASVPPDQEFGKQAAQSAVERNAKDVDQLLSKFL